MAVDRFVRFQWLTFQRVREARLQLRLVRPSSSLGCIFAPFFKIFNLNLQQINLLVDVLQILILHLKLIYHLVQVFDLLRLFLDDLV